MKGKALLCLAIVFSIALSLMPTMVMASPATLEVIFQDTGTSTYIIESCVPPVTFKVDLEMSGVTDMWGWSTQVLWNKDVLNCTKKEKGPFNPDGTSLLGVIDNTVGWIERLAAGTTEEDTETGSGVVCTLTFVAHHTGISYINLTDGDWIDYPDKVVEDLPDSSGLFECRAYVGPPTAAKPKFTPITCTQFRLDKDTLEVTVDFDACASQGSYDPLPDPGTSNPIQAYRWDFDDDDVWDYISSSTFTLSVENIDDYFYELKVGEYDLSFLGWSCKVEWDSDLLYCTGFSGEPTIETFGLEGVDYSILGYIDNGNAVIEVLVWGALDYVPAENVSGSGPIAELYFIKETCGAGAGDINITESMISTYYMGVGDGHVYVEPYTPEFEVSYTAPPECTASWTYDDTYPIDNPVTLEVYAPDCDPSETHPDFITYTMHTRSVTNVIHILPPVMGPDIDVYVCNRDEPHKGIGKGCDKITGVEYPPVGEPPFQTWTAMADAYGPQEEVCVCALVTYNNEPVENKLVAFEVRDPDNNVVVWRSAATNSEGIACVDFRIPWTGSTAEDLFGAWLLIGTVDIAEQVVIDKCRFRFGWIVSIAGIAVDPSALYKFPTEPHDLDIMINLTNIAFTPKDVYLTVVLYDECGVPINHFGAPATVDPVSYEAPVITLTIPKWAFVGSATVYVNVFDAPPGSGGTPMCPEDDAPFAILNTP